VDEDGSDCQRTDDPREQSRSGHQQDDRFGQTDPAEQSATY